MNTETGIHKPEAETFLTKYYDSPIHVELLGEGAWSRCFGYQHNVQELVIRFGNYVEDFEKDRLAYRHVADHLPVPQVLDIGQAYDGYYAISTRVTGAPLENVTKAEWPTLVPSVVAMLEALRTADLAPFIGYGGWHKEGNAHSPTWSADLLSIANDPPDPTDERNSGWRAKLAQYPDRQSTFEWGAKLLKQTIRDDIPRCLIHGDLINRNVLIENNQISGVFDWGCSRYGDHLYDLAWFEFWDPWYPEMDVGLLRSELEKRWHDVGYDPHEKEARLKTYYLHIGLDHLAYNASIGGEEDLMATARRMRELVV